MLFDRRQTETLSHGSEAAPVDRARTKLLQAPQVLGRAVAHVLPEAVARMDLVELAHQRVARRLGQDRRRRNATLAGIAVDDRACRDRQARHLVTVDQSELGGDSKQLDGTY